ncbi:MULTISPECIES: hypothetical protein [unclassified Streptomyces]|uniref:hypothetical protein n=1 Tax=unclassified Streptomyces TaxID=2593676 RepID=UPI0036E0CBA5
MTMQCKDIPDEMFRDAIRKAPHAVAISWRMAWAVHEELEELLGREVPVNLFFAKARKLVDAGKIGGCACGCRGDFHLPEDCLGMCCQEVAA